MLILNAIDNGLACDCGVYSVLIMALWLAKQMRRDNQDVMGEKPVRNDAGQLSLDEESKKEAWKEHYERLLNIEFPWNPEDLSEESLGRQPAVVVAYFIGVVRKIYK